MAAKKTKFSKTSLLIFGLVFAAIGGYVIFKSLAVSSALPGDLDNDGSVAQGDLVILVVNFNTSYAGADINGDGIVNFLDSSILLSHYGETLNQPLTEIASESVCPNQTDNAVSDSLKYTAMICLTSNARAFNGLGAVSQNSALAAAALSKVNDIITCNDFSHTACGRAFDYWILQNNYSGHCWGENIAVGYANVHDTFVGWMNSAGHRANILNTNFRDIGMGWGNMPGRGALWVMELGGC